MGEAVSYFKNQDVTHFIFGDIAVSNAKEVREKKFNPLGIEIVEPLWDKNTRRSNRRIFEIGN